MTACFLFVTDRSVIIYTITEACVRMQVCAGNQAPKGVFVNRLPPHPGVERRRAKAGRQFQRDRPTSYASTCARSCAVIFQSAACAFERTCSGVLAPASTEATAL